MTPTSPVIQGLEQFETVFAKDQPEYLPLPAIVGSDGTVLTHWKCSWRDRLSILLSGSLWLVVKTFNNPLQPVMLLSQPPFKSGEVDPI